MPVVVFHGVQKNMLLFVPLVSTFFFSKDIIALHKRVFGVGGSTCLEVDLFDLLSGLQSIRRI